MKPPVQLKRSLWPWVIAGYFAAALVGIACFITWAATQKMDLVRSDYYEHEIRFQNHIDALKRAKRFAPTAGVLFDATEGRLNLQIPATHLARRESFSGELHLYRPSDAKLDRQFHLTPDATGTQSFKISGLAPGLWKTRLEWTVNGHSYAVENSFILE